MVQVQDPADKVVPPAGVLSCVPHPGLPGGAVILLGSRLGTAAVLESPGRTAPVLLTRGKVPGWSAVVGMGVCRTSGTVLAFGQAEGGGGGRLRSACWRLSYRAGAGGLALRQTRLEPQDLTPLLDSHRRTRSALAAAMTAGAATAAAAALPTASAAAESAAAAGGPRNLTSGGAASAAAVANGGASNGTSAAGPASGPPSSSSSWLGLWSSSPAWVHEATPTCLLDPQLSPPVGRVAVHPALGLVAVAGEAPPAARVHREVQMAGRGALAGEEAALARRGGCMSLLLVSNLEAHGCRRS
ncbi:hypothetical protein Agub_g10922 [Astrephomene gubernaculifera]|uniref:Uncharacterized protein n=1 Tax=Astrephomene gubernaculifera TaxID=47775 RepID=A0AAD3DW00_9CHLO|nr:hypothetical protein Agub_g10922 [Astrephomene gubernaculifera]